MNFKKISNTLTWQDKKMGNREYLVYFKKKKRQERRNRRTKRKWEKWKTNRGTGFNSQINYKWARYSK